MLPVVSKECCRWPRCPLRLQVEPRLALESPSGRRRESPPKRGFWGRASRIIDIMSSKKNYQQWRKLGACVNCGKTPEEGRVYCTICKEKRQRSKKLRIDRNLCDTCGDKVQFGERRYCLKCKRKRYFKKLSLKLFGTSKRADELKALFVEQQVCVYSGRVLEIGVNLSLDHKLAKSKGGSNKSENFQWVDRRVNIMKGDMSEEDFLSLVKDIYLYAITKPPVVKSGGLVGVVG